MSLLVFSSIYSLLKYPDGTFSYNLIAHNYVMVLDYKIVPARISAKCLWIKRDE